MKSLRQTTAIVTLVERERSHPDGTITESDQHTGHWAWKHPHMTTVQA